jgi:ribose transport system substrate-binding protein
MASSDTHRPRSSPVPRIGILLAGAAALLLAVACGSSGGGSGSGGSSSASSSSADAAGLAKAKAFLAKAEARPTQITNTVKIGKPVPKGKTIDFVTCGATPECTQEGAIVKEAASMLGWTTVVLNNDGTPSTQKANFNQVVRTKPDAVLYSAIARSTFASELSAMKKNGTFVAGCCVTDAVGNGLDYEIDVPAQVGPIGGAQAAWVAADSKDTASSVIVSLPAFAILDTGVTDYKSGMATYCPTCKVSELDIALANIATAPTTIVSYLRAHPGIKYVVAATDGLTIGLPAALKAASMTDVKIVGQGATPTNLQYLHSGQQAADVAFPYYEALYAMVNAAAEHEAGMPVHPSVAPPLWVLTPENAPPATAKPFPVVTDYKSQYAALWGLK